MELNFDVNVENYMENKELIEKLNLAKQAVLDSDVCGHDSLMKKMKSEALNETIGETVLDMLISKEAIMLNPVGILGKSGKILKRRDSDGTWVTPSK